AAHVPHRRSGAGALPGTAAFANEPASGWQQVSFGSPVAVSANTTYVISYSSPRQYLASNGVFASAVSTPPLTALADGTDGFNGVFSSGSGVFPSSHGDRANYWVDVVFTDQIVTGQVDHTSPTIVTRSPSA